MSLFATLLPAEDGLDLPPEEIIFGSTRAMALVRRQVENAASADIPVLIGGASGTGKEVIAKLIHRRSPWRTGSFVKVNCPAIPATLVESELFGCEKGAFSGAYAAKPGCVEATERGSLFLDGIGELEPALQVKLVQLLQDGRFCRIGAQRDQMVEVRVLCATNHDLAAKVRVGAFRADLFYWINVLAIHLPTLAERREDIPILVRYLTERYSAWYGQAPPPMSKRMLKSLAVQPWPGNIRQLENMVKRYVVVGSAEAFAETSFDDLGNNGDHRDGAKWPGESLSRGNDSRAGLREAVKQLERDLILRTLDANGWNRRLAAQALRISYATLLYKMREAGIPSARRSASGGVAGKLGVSRCGNP